MKHLAAYLLLGLGGNSSPSAKDVKKVLASVGIEADNDRLKALIDELKDKDINEVRRRPPQPLTRDSDVSSCSSSPKVRASSLAFHRAARAAVPRRRPEVLLAATPAARRRPRRRRKRRRRSLTRTWALVCSIRGVRESVRSGQIRRAEHCRLRSIISLCLAASTVKRKSDEQAEIICCEFYMTWAWQHTCQLHFCAIFPSGSLSFDIT
jgi:hypothetical protein